MSTNDVILIAQTVVGIITLGVLVWYTYETRRIRLDASNQNNLIAEQLLIMQQSLNFQQNREAQSVQPFFAWQCWGCTGSEVYYRFVNHGASISNVEVNATGGLNGFLIPKDLAAGQQGEFKFTGLKRQQFAEPFDFAVEFTDKLNQRRKVNYSVSLNKGGDLGRPQLLNN